jgi:hypothetical protein
MTVGSDTTQWLLSGVANGGAIWQKSNSVAGGSDDRYLRLGNINNAGEANYVMTIFNSNVGIGTTSPSTLLHIKTAGDGYNMFTVEATNGDAGIAIKGGSAGSSVGGWTIQGQNAGSLVIVDRNSTATERMRITSAGNVGIGTSSPTGKFSVNTGASNQIAFFNNSTSGGTYNIISLNGSYSEGTNMSIQGGGVGDANLYVNSGYTSSTSGAIVFRTGSATVYTERMLITSMGNISFNGGNTTTGNPTTAPKNFRFNNDYSSGTTDASLKIYLFNQGSTIQGFTSGPGYDLQYHTSGSSLGKHVFYVQNSAIMTIGSSNILMGTTTDNGERLYVSGAIRATGNITANSDLTLKKNLTIIDNPIDKLMQLNGYAYQWKANDEYQYGVIAQEVEKVLPYAVQTGNDKIKGVAYNQLTPLLIEGFKSHESEITQLKKRIKIQQAEIDILKSKLA